MLSSSLRRLVGLFSTSGKSGRSYRHDRRRDTRSHLSMEQLENRRLMATDLGAIGGTAFTDFNDDGLVAAGETRLTGITVELFRDVNGNSTFEPNAGDGVAIGTQTTNVAGNYRFDGLTAGTYFVRQTANSGDSVGLLQRVSVQTVTISAAQATGTVTPVDDFTTGATGGGAQTVTATPGTNQSSIATIAGVLGGERELFVQNTGTTDDIVAVVDNANSDQLSFSFGNSAQGSVFLTYDGTGDINAGDDQTVAGAGLGGVDITQAGARNAFQFLARTDTSLAPVNLIVTAFDGINQVSVTVAIPVSLNAQEVLVPFTSFPGVDLTNLGALRIEVNTSISADGDITFAGAIGPTLITNDLPFLQPMSIGDQVFSDLDNNGLFDAGEIGIENVVLQLFLDADGDGIINNGESAVLDGNGVARTATTDASGNYLFNNLLPSSPTTANPAIFQSYAIVIANGQTALTNFSNSTGNDISGAAPDPNNDVNNDDNGTVIGTNTISTGLVLTANAEPVNDGDTDANTNLTLDFGFVPSIDVQIVKSGTATVVAGGNINYSLVVTNNSTMAVTNVIVTDDLPAGVTFLPAGTAGSSSSAGLIVQADPNAELTTTIATLAAGASQTFNITVSTDPAASLTTLNNNSSVTSDGIDTVPANNQSSAPTILTRNAVLTLTKSDGTRTAVRAGDQFVYTLTVTNTGVSTANNVLLTDLLPAGYNFTSFTTTAGNPQVATVNGRPQITATSASLAVNGQLIVGINVSVDPAISGTSITNTATVISDDSSQITAIDTNTVVRQGDLSIVKTVSSPSTTAGGQVTYTIQITNNGPINVTNVEVDDDLPDGFTLAAGGPASVTASPNATRDLLYSVGDLATGQSKTVSFPVNVAANVVAGNYTNTATIAVGRLNGFTDTVASNNTSQAVVSIPVVVLPVSSLSGFVYQDINRNGVRDAGIDLPIAGTRVLLSGTVNGVAIAQQTAITDNNGAYTFGNLQAGTYTVTEVQPLGFIDSNDTAGTTGGVAGNDIISQIVLGAGINSQLNNFGEIPGLSKRSFLSYNNPVV